VQRRVEASQRACAWTVATQAGTSTRPRADFASCTRAPHRAHSGMRARLMGSIRFHSILRILGLNTVNAHLCLYHRTSAASMHQLGRPSRRATSPRSLGTALPQLSRPANAGASELLRASNASQPNQLGIETRGKGGRVPVSALVGSRAEITFADGVVGVDADEAVRVRPDCGRDYGANGLECVLAAPVLFATALRNGEESERSSWRALRHTSRCRASPGPRSS
jgi:hypothetical protein